VNPPSPEIVITHNFPRVSNQSTNNHSLPYAEGTVNPYIRRRKAKKKALARDVFPSKLVETVNDEFLILPPQIETPDEVLTIPDISSQIELKRVKNRC